MAMSIAMPLRAIRTIAWASSSRQLLYRPKRKALLTSFRAFSTAPIRGARRRNEYDDMDEDPHDDGDDEDDDFDEEGESKDDITEDDPNLTDAEKAELKELDEFMSPEEMKAFFDEFVHETQDLLDPDDPIPPDPKIKEGFIAMDEDPENQDDDPEFEPNDISSLAHGELEQHRELREYARVIAWDMPLLWNHTRPFKAPGISQPLRFRYTTYMGEHHPAARKVVMEFSPTQVGELKSFSEVQTAKLVKLLGVRFNPETGFAKISCEMYPTSAQNKRYLGDLLKKLLTEVETGKDTFEDVPFDFRHHKFKPKYSFPEEWKMTESRRAELDAKRKEKQLLTEQKAAGGKAIDGRELINRMLAIPSKDELDSVPALAASIRRARF